jgi:hypothetical protein
MSQESGSHPLTSQHEGEFSNFQNVLTSWADAYPYSIISYVAVKTAKGPRLVFGRILLLPSRVELNAPKFEFETEHIIAARHTSDIRATDTASYLKKAKAGQIPAMDSAMSIELEREISSSVYFDALGSRLFPVPEGIRSPCLVMTGISRWTLLSSSLGTRPLEQLDWELKAAKIPFYNLDELLTYCGLPTLSQIGDSTMLEILASPPGWIDNGSTIRKNEATIDCRIASALDIRKIALGYKIFQKDSVRRESTSGSNLEWKQESDWRIGRCQIAVGEAPLLQAFLSYERVCLHQWWVTDPQKHLNSRHAIHQVFDRNSDILKGILLQPEANKADAFENAVSALFNLLGFSSLNYARLPRLQDSPDIIAVTPNGNIQVIECTLGLLDKGDKLAKLVWRTTQIKEKLALAGHGHLQIQSAIVTPLSRDKVEANLKAASENLIAVICREEIEKLLMQVTLPQNPEKIFQEIKALMPAVSS